MKSSLIGKSLVSLSSVPSSYDTMASAETGNFIEQPVKQSTQLCARKKAELKFFLSNPTVPIDTNHLEHVLRVIHYRFGKLSVLLD